MKPAIAITLLIFFLAPAALFGQAPQVKDYYDGIERNRVNREKELHESNQRKQLERLNKFAYSLLRQNSEICQDSRGLFGSERPWTAGADTFSGKLVKVENGSVTIIIKNGHVKKKLTHFSEENQQHIDLFLSWHKLGSSGRKEWLEDYFAPIEPEKEESTIVADATAAERQEELALANFSKLKFGYSKIVVGKTSETELYSFLGNPSHSSRPIMFWDGENAETGEHLTISVEIRDSRVFVAIQDQY